MNPKIYNEKRRILFSTIHNKGIEVAREYLEGYKKVLGSKGYKGLKTEINFYERNRKDLQLTVSADVGDHTDFSGFLDKKIFRLDVTSNIKYKEMSTYEPLQKKDGARYKIILANEDGEIGDIIDINFPFCTNCQDGRLIDVGALTSTASSSEDYSNIEYKQIHFGICHICGYSEKYKEIESIYLPTFWEECGFFSNEIDRYNSAVESIGEYMDFDSKKYINQHVNNILPHLQANFDKKLMALGDLESDSIEVMWQDKIRIVKSYIKRNYSIK